MKAISLENARLIAASRPVPATTFLALGVNPGAFVITGNKSGKHTESGQYPCNFS